MRVSAGNSTAVLRCNTANSSLTIDGKFEILNKRIGSVQFDRKVLRKPALHIAKPLPNIKMNETAKIDIQGMTEKLIELANKSCWNNFSDSYSYIFSEIINDETGFNEKRIIRRKSNAKKTPLNLDQACEKLDKLYPNLYDVNFYVYKASKNNTIIEIQYFPKSSLDKDYFEKVKNNLPMLHCKISNPIYMKNDNDKFDINWELGGLRHIWNMFWHKKLIKNLNR